MLAKRIYTVLGIGDIKEPKTSSLGARVCCGLRTQCCPSIVNYFDIADFGFNEKEKRLNVCSGRKQCKFPQS